MLTGVTGELLLVLKTHDEDQLISIIKKLKTIRNKEIKELAEELEASLYD